MHINDPTITSTERVKLKILIAFFSFKYPQLKIHTCYNATTELTQEERNQIIRESHGSMMAQHFEENKSIQRARELGIWTNMENDITEYVKNATYVKRKS